MVLDHERVEPNPARDRLVKLPRETKRIVQPPTAGHVEAVVRLLPTRYRLPALVLDATGMRIGELEALVWGDVDEPRGRWRITTSKTGRPRWVTPSELLFNAVTDLLPRDDRVADRPVFEGFGGDRFRTALQRACVAAGVPAFSPHDLPTAGSPCFTWPEFRGPESANRSATTTSSPRPAPTPTSSPTRASSTTKDCSRDARG
jgi:integrase